MLCCCCFKILSYRLYVLHLGYDVFKDYRDNGYNVVAVKFDWSQVYHFLLVILWKEVMQNICLCTWNMEI